MITKAIITFSNHFNHAFTLSALSALDIILNPWTTIIRIAATNANAFMKDKTKNNSELWSPCILLANHSVPETCSTFITDHKIHTHPKNKTDHIMIYNNDIIAGLSFSEFHHESSSCAPDKIINNTTSAYHMYLITHHKDPPRTLELHAVTTLLFG